MPPPTEKQLRVFEFIVDFTFAQGFPPVVREIGDHFGIRYTNGMMCHLRALVKKGLLRRVSYKHGGFRRVLYLPAVPTVRVDRSGRGGVMVGSTGMPATFTEAAWVSWLREQLAAAEGMRP